MKKSYVPAFAVAAAGLVAFAPDALADDATANDPPAPAPTEASFPGPAPTTEAPAETPAVDSAEVDDEGQTLPKLKHVAITANPLSIFVGRWSVNFEYLPARHHAIIVVPSLWTLSANSNFDSNKSETSFRYLGGELGYHFYTGDRGANGFFVGPSLVYMNMKVTEKLTNSAGTTETSASSSLYGMALDIGGQYVAKGGFTIGGGGGLMWVKVKDDTKGTNEPSIKLSGTLPRFLFTIGYSF
ncbi:MAG TPA: hypothetical protein PLI95_01310 [Polyangiaceae bacterium]|nr:hypothetical protein [Polyangiaceae bacterium]